MNWTNDIAILARARLLFIGGIVCVIAGLISCGTVSTERGSEYRSEEAGFLPYDGPKEKVQIVELSIPEEIVAQYPELQERRIGWGMYNRIIEGLFDSGRFELLEEKTELQKKILEQWEFSESGLAAKDQVIEGAGFDIARYLIYAEVCNVPQ